MWSTRNYIATKVFTQSQSIGYGIQPSAGCNHYWQSGLQSAAGYKTGFVILIWVWLEYYATWDTAFFLARSLVCSVHNPEIIMIYDCCRNMWFIYCSILSEVVWMLFVSFYNWKPGTSTERLWLCSNSENFLLLDSPRLFTWCPRQTDLDCVHFCFNMCSRRTIHIFIWTFANVQFCFVVSQACEGKRDDYFVSFWLSPCLTTFAKYDCCVQSLVCIF